MKKTLKLLMILAVAIVLLTGCAKIDYTVDVKEDGKAEVSYIIAVENEYLETTHTNPEATTTVGSSTTEGSVNIYMESLKSKAKDAESKGYTTKEYKDSKYTGYTITKSFDKVEDVSLQDAFGDDIIKNDGDAKIKFEKKGSNIKISQDATFDLTQYSQGYQIVYTVNLPVKVTENNATKTDGNKLTWDLTGQTAGKVNFKAEGGASIFGNLTTVLIIVGVAVLAIVIVVVVIAIVKSKKKNNNA